MNRNTYFCFFSKVLLGVLFFLGSSFFPANTEEKVVRLVPEEYDVWSCDWSVDGRIAFAGKLQGEKGIKTRIWLCRPDSESSPVHWTETGSLVDFSPRWSPEGDGVVMVRRKIEDPLEEGLHSSIWWKAYPSGEGRQLTGGPWDLDPSWSPDGEFIVFVRGDGPFLSSLAAVGKNGGEVMQLTPLREGCIMAPVWTVDNRIYYTVLELEEEQVDLEDENYTTQRIGKGDIWYLDLMTKEEKPFLADEFDNRYSAVSPDGRYLAFVSTRGVTVDETRPVRDRAALFVFDLVTGQQYLVGQGVNINGAPPVWSSDGKKLSFFSFRQNQPAMWTMPWEPAG